MVPSNGGEFMHRVIRSFHAIYLLRSLIIYSFVPLLHYLKEKYDIFLLSKGMKNMFKALIHPHFYQYISDNAVAFNVSSLF